MRTRRILVGALVAAIGVAALASADPVNVPNGNFEAGNLSKWKRFEPGGGEWFVYDVYPEEPPPKPRGLGGSLQFPDPPQGQFAAGLDQGGPGLNILHRVLKLKPDKTNKIRFQLFYRNTAPRFISPKSFKFDHEMGVPIRRGNGGTNQQLRVDLMKPKAGIKSLKKDDVLATLLRTKPGDRLRTPYKVYKANLTKLGIDRRRVRLRIAEVDDFGNFFVGVDKLTQKAE